MIGITKEILDQTVLEALPLSVRAHSAIARYEPNVKTLRDLIQKEEKDLLRIPNFGRVSIKEVKDALGAMGLTLGTDPDSIPPTLDKITEDLHYSLIDHASSAAGKSLDVILQKKEWAYNDIEKYFKTHQKIMEYYKESLQRLHD